MCGIAGVVSWDRPIAEPARVARVLADALAHRGPDGRATWIPPSEDVLLVHRRLAIIDPGPDGAQPMATPDGRHRIVFNGEVYNYRELRRDLEAGGERFSTASDTEVLLRLIVRGGPAALARVRGMFAFAWWDAEERTLLVARGRFGLKALYVAPARHAVRESVRAHLVADVPVGVFLSGGIDSGAIVSAAASAGASNLQTFTVGFDDVTSEVERARSVATEFGTRHHELRLDASHVAADLPKILTRLDQPTIDAVNSYTAQQAVRAAGTHP